MGYQVRSKFGKTGNFFRGDAVGQGKEEETRRGWRTKKLLQRGPSEKGGDKIPLKATGKEQEKGKKRQSSVQKAKA